MQDTFACARDDRVSCIQGLWLELGLGFGLGLQLRVKKPICRNIREAVKILSPLVINQNLLEYNLFSVHGSYNPRSQMSKLDRPLNCQQYFFDLIEISLP